MFEATHIPNEVWMVQLLKFGSIAKSFEPETFQKQRYMLTTISYLLYKKGAE
jgi:hypothetical protein